MAWFDFKDIFSTWMILLLTEGVSLSYCISHKTLNNPSGYRNMKTANTAAVLVPELCVPLV